MFKSLLYIIAVVLVLGWLLGIFYFKSTGQLLHILLVLAVISLLTGIFRKDSVD